jgi:hypothetical protein
MKTHIYDCEVYPNYFLCIAYDIDTKIYHSYELGKQLLDKIILNDEITLVGFNNHGYDDVILKYIQNCALTIRSGFFKGNQQFATTQSIYELSNEIIELGWDSTRVRDLRWQESVFDTIDVQAVFNPMPSLKKTEIRMHYQQVEDLPYAPGTILTEPEKAITQEYCYNDVGATFKLYDEYAREHIKLREYLAARFNLSASKLRSLSEAKTAEYILSQMACKAMNTKLWEIRKKLEEQPVYEIELKQCIPSWIAFKTEPLQSLLAKLKHTTLPINAKTGYADGTKIKQTITVGNKQYQIGIGGLHSIDGPYQWRPTNDYQLLDADVTSYYPSILLRDGLYPRGYSSIWVDTYRHIYDTRLKAKQAGNLIEANALKIVLNATFGKLGSIWSSFYDPQLLVRVTLTGQLGLLMLIEALERYGVEVISANTDGIIIKKPNDQDNGGGSDLSFKRLCETWQTQTKMNLEYTYYNEYARRDVNNYTALTTDNKVKNKGIFTPQDLKHDVQAPIIQKMARANLLYGERAVDYLFENKNDLTIYDFLFSFTGVKGWVITLNDEVKSKSNRWYVSTEPLNNKLVKTGGKLQNTISIPNGTNIVIMNEVRSTALPDDLDYQYYLDAANKLISTCRKETP